MIGKETVTRGQVQKSNGKVTTRLERQGERKAWMCGGNAGNGGAMALKRFVMTRKALERSRKEKQWTRREYRCAGKDRIRAALALRGVALRRK